MVGIVVTMPALCFDLRRLRYLAHVSPFGVAGWSLGVAGAELLETILLGGDATSPLCGNTRSPATIRLFIFAVSWEGGVGRVVDGGERQKCIFCCAPPFPSLQTAPSDGDSSLRCSTTPPRHRPLLQYRPAQTRSISLQIPIPPLHRFPRQTNRSRRSSVLLKVTAPPQTETTPRLTHFPLIPNLTAKLTTPHSPGFAPDSPIARWRDNILNKVAWTAGHDWYFTSTNSTTQNVAIGIADGVGGWEDSGVDPSHFSQALMYHCEMAVESSAAKGTAKDPAESLSPTDIMTIGFAGVTEEKGVIAGSSTACVITLDAATGILDAAK